MLSLVGQFFLTGGGCWSGVILLHISFHNAGGYSYNDDNNDVQEYDVENHLWIKIGEISMKRSYHAVSVINYNSIKDYCN